jgi:large subunit ribosomal protein L4
LNSVLIVVEAFDESLLLAARNLPHVTVLEADSVDPVSLARHEKVLITVPAARMLEGSLA